MSQEDIKKQAPKHAWELLERKPSTHAQELEAKLIQERRLGQVKGPFGPPPELEEIPFLGSSDGRRPTPFPYGAGEWVASYHFDVQQSGGDHPPPAPLPRAPMQHNIYSDCP